MTGEKTKILGKIGDFEIGARWQWKLPLHMITLCVLVLILISLLLLVAGFFYLRIQFLQMSKIQSELQVQLEEVQRLKGEFAAIATQSHGISVPPASIRFKRGSSSRRGKKLIKSHKEGLKQTKNSKARETSYLTNHSKGIYSVGDLTIITTTMSSL